MEITNQVFKTIIDTVTKNNVKRTTPDIYKYLTVTNNHKEIHFDGFLFRSTIMNVYIFLNDKPNSVQITRSSFRKQLDKYLIQNPEVKQLPIQYNLFDFI